MSIRCGHCKGTHETFPEARECSQAYYAARAERQDTPSDGANRMAAALAVALAPPAQEAQEAPAPPARDTLAEEGVYRRQGRIYRVVTRGGKRLAEEYVRGAYCYARGMVYRLQPADRMTLAECQEWGRQEVRCIRCGTPLEREDSRAAGIGPKCATKI